MQVLDNSSRLEGLTMSIKRSDLITALINAQDNFDVEYYELFKMYKDALNNDAINLKYTSEFIIDNDNLLRYINKSIIA
mgnify:CR=1 FL=1